MGMGYGGLLIGLGILFAVGFIVPLMISPFVPEGAYNPSSIAVPLIDFVANGINMDWVPLLPDFNINIFGIFGIDVQDFMISQVEAFTYIPNAVSIPLLVLSFALMIYSVIPFV